ncbi:hypothetical protein [Nocardia wallacei]|uniref:hypothetical protein n=1 Tax=Nocardia wallacei TaxID=480035 RepID=UPI002455E0C9|nr:hypothetical protein [Nocardia wallacei]
MKIHTFTTAALAAAAITGTAATVHAQPAPETAVAAAPSVHATDHGIAYTTTLTEDGCGALTTVGDARLAPGSDAASVALIDNASGVAVATIPLGLPTTSGLAGVAAQIGDGGRTLTLTPQPTGESPTAQAIDEAADTVARKQHNAVVGALVGAGIGAVLGFFLGGVGALATVPVGAGLGALIGYATP